MEFLVTGILYASVCYLINTTPVSSDSVSVITQAGIFKGYTREFEAFGIRSRVEKYLGIPYAEAPVGSRRFQKPVLKEKLNDSYDATNYGSVCFQIPFRFAGVRNPTNTIRHSEDCLFLNIVVPDRTTGNSKELLPVMVWIHGGGYNIGQSNLYVGDTLSTVGNVVFVSINYRLAIWGFVSTGDRNLPGNYGLWDQHTALQWIHTNIADFGGDPDHVTLIGQSAGAASVLHQSLYAGNKGLFHRAIALSGTITCPWAFNSHPLKATKHLALLAGCQISDDTHALAECIKSVPNDKLNDILLDNADIIAKFPLDFVVAFDGEFVKEPTKDIISSTTDISSADRDFFGTLDFLTGNVEGEGLMNVCPFVGVGNCYEDFIVTRRTFEEFFIPEALKNTYGYDIPSIVNEMVISEYTDWSNPDDISKARDKFIDMTSDYVFKIHTGDTIRLHATNSQNNAYLYHFDAAVPSQHLICYPHWTKDPAHCDELTFMFGYDPDGSTSWTMPWEEDFRPQLWEYDMSKFFMTMLTNFVKSGNPNEPEDIEYYTGTRWPTYDSVTQHYLNISRDMSPASVGRRLYANAEHFWNNLLPSAIREYKSHHD